MNTCDYYQELISRMLDDELSNNERSVLAEHLYMCDECAAMYSAFSMVSDMLATDLVEAPEELAEDVMAHIRRAEIRKRNRRNTRATKNAIAAAACVAFVVAAAGGVAVVRNHRSDNVVYESRLSQSTAASSAKDGSYDTVIVSEAPVQSEEKNQYVAPVEKYTAAPQQEEKSSFFASILPDSWFSAPAPAATQAPVIYATPVATPYAQQSYAPQTYSQADSNMPAVVVVTPTETQAPVVVITPAPTDTPVELPVATEAPVAEVLPVVTEAPVAEVLPVVTDAPAVEELPVVTDAPVVEELPVGTDAPVVEELPVVTEAPVVEELPIATETPVMELPPVNELPMMEFAPVPELPALEQPIEETASAELPVLDAAIEENLNAAPESFTQETPAELPLGPVVASHDFSAIDCAEFIEALFSPKKEEQPAAAAELPAQGEEPAVDEQAQQSYPSYVDKLIAENEVELCTLPENVEAQRTETISFSADNQLFTVQVSFYEDVIYVLSHTGDGNAVSFQTGLSAAEYDTFLTACYTLNENR